MNFLPSELIRNGIDSYLSNYPATSRKIYLSVIVFVVIVIGALPFVFVDISVQNVGIIRSDSTLYAEIYVSPRNIGYIGKNMPVSIQISSFNYNEWGNISGKVTEISSDFLTDNAGNGAFYKVKCSMDKNCLTRKNGATGLLKNGMTAIAHFKITKRSLFDCLYQKMDDWINPTQYEKEYSNKTARYY